MQVEEDGIAGWQMGSAVALCHNCCDNGRDNAGISNLLESDQPSHSQGENSQSIASSSLPQVQFDCASRGFHEYRQIWNPRIGQKLDIEQDYGSINDPFSMAIKAVLRGRIQYWETVGHIPREISRFCCYFINYGGTLEARLRDVRYRRSPIPSGGLEIPITLIVKRETADGDICRKMKELVETYYIEPEKISSSSTIAIAEGDDDMEETFEPDEELNQPIEDEIVNLEEDTIILIDDDDELMSL